MAEMWANARAVYHTVVEESADSRTKDWPLVHNVWTAIIVSVLYNLFCWNAKRLTAGFPALSMRPIIVFYSFTMVLVNIYLTCELFVSAYLASYSLFCQPVDHSTQPLALRMANALWWYYLSKYVDLVETFLYALRKKYNQITVLHVYHHTGMILFWGVVVRYLPGGQTFMIAMINTFVHAVMYTYYGLSAIGPHMQRYLWWKKYITIIQLTQFFVDGGFLISNLLLPCNFPSWFTMLTFVHVVILIALFLNFYFRAYSSKNRKATNDETPVCNGILKEPRVNEHNGLQKAKAQ